MPSFRGHLNATAYSMQSHRKARRLSRRSSRQPLRPEMSLREELLVLNSESIQAPSAWQVAFVPIHFLEFPVDGRFSSSFSRVVQAHVPPWSICDGCWQVAAVAACAAV